MRSNKIIAVFICIISFLNILLYAGDLTYTKSTQITLNTSSTGANVNENYNNLPVLIKLDISNFDFTALNDSLPGDIRFEISEGTYIPYKIKLYNKSGNTAELWIILPKVYGNNNTQSITLSWGKNSESLDQATIQKIESKKAHIIENATSFDEENSLFKSSYDTYGVWDSNSANGFSIIGGNIGL